MKPFDVARCLGPLSCRGVFAQPPPLAAEERAHLWSKIEARLPRDERPAHQPVPEQVYQAAELRQDA